MDNLFTLLLELKLSDFVEAIDKPQIDYSVRLTKFNKRTKRLIFKCGDYIVKVGIPSYKVISRYKGKFSDKLRMSLKNEDIKVDCNCPDFRYGGSRYNLNQMDASVYSEKRPPNIKDPNRDHFGCKHVKHTLTFIKNKL